MKIGKEVFLEPKNYHKDSVYVKAEFNGDAWVVRIYVYLNFSDKEISEMWPYVGSKSFQRFFAQLQITPCLELIVNPGEVCYQRKSIIKRIKS